MPQSPRAVFVETSNAFFGTEGRLGSFHSGGEQREGGHLVTAGAQHWIVTVGDYMYQAGDTDGMNVAECDDKSSCMAGCTKAGLTTKTDEEIELFLEGWNADGGGCRAYNLITNSCQTFAVHLVHFLCEGQGRLPNAGGVQFSVDQHHVIASAGMGEVACASFGGAKAAISAPAVGFQGIKGRGAFIQAEVGKAELGADTALGHVGVSWGLNANTGAGVRDGNVEASLVGFGMKAGRDGVGVMTPIAGADCCIM